MPHIGNSVHLHSALVWCMTNTLYPAKMSIQFSDNYHQADFREEDTVGEDTFLHLFQ